MFRFGAVAILCLLCNLTSSALARVDALTATAHTTDADRFAAVFDAAHGKPTAQALQKGYLDPGSRGVEIFTPNRIRSADNLAATVAAHAELYRRAVDICLPIAKESSAELRAIYLALEGLLGEVDLPEVYIVFGANNSGGTAAPGAQVLGLEVLCRLTETEEAMRKLLRTFYAHETVHALQAPEDAEVFRADPLLFAVMREGSADFIARLVTGKVPDRARDAWARPREAFVWREFLKDRKALLGMTEEQIHEASSPLHRWIANAGRPPEGWPGELGYWLGMRICMAYVDAAEDKRAAVKTLLAATDYRPILEKSGYAESFR